MSLDIDLIAVRPTSVFEGNITHNLAEMAGQAGLYEALWRPDEHGYKTAESLIHVLDAGLQELKDNKEKYKAYNPKNGWGDYETLVDFVDKYLTACIKDPDAIVETWR